MYRHREFKPGERVRFVLDVALTHGFGYDAEDGAEAIVRKPIVAPGNMMLIAWDKDDHRVHGQNDGEYFCNSFEHLGENHG